VSKQRACRNVCFRRQVKIALCQLEVGTDKQENIRTATKAVKVRHKGAQAPVMAVEYLCNNIKPRTAAYLLCGINAECAVTTERFSMPCLPDLHRWIAPRFACAGVAGWAIRWACGAV